MLATAPTENVYTNGICDSNRFPKLSTTKMSSKNIRYTWRHTDAVCFDVDSTVCRDEAIDELANFCGVGQQVAELTKVAMNGNMTFREALTVRLNMISPSKQQLQQYIEQNPPRMTPGIVELVDVLHKKKVHVFLVTGGFRTIVLPVAKRLNIPEANVFANVLQFDTNGKYAGFDHNQLTSDSGGKTEVCSYLKVKYGFKNLIMVGDGATDMETCPVAADGFIGFGGNAVRENVKNGCEWYVYNFDELRAALNTNV